MTTYDNIPSSLFLRPVPTRILRSELNHLLEMLQMTDANLKIFGQEASRHPVVYKQILRLANSSLTGSSVEITDTAHATLFLGTRRVEFLLNSLPSEIIEEDLEEDDKLRTA